MNKELSQQALDVLNDSLDCVATEYAIYLENYGDYPSRKARIDGLKIGVDKHKAAIKALEVAIAQPEQGKLLQIIAAMYQIAGAYDAPEHVLDVLANPEGATQEQIDSLLPFNIAQIEQTAVFPSGLVEILREAANIINAIDIAHAPANIRWPIVDELDGFSLMVAQPEHNDHGKHWDRTCPACNESIDYEPATSAKPTKKKATQ